MGPAGVSTARAPGKGGTDAPEPRPRLGPESPVDRELCRAGLRQPEDLALLRLVLPLGRA